MADRHLGRRLEHFDWLTLQEQAARAGSTVLWPIGAIEQHGPHLPISTDALFADRVADAVLAQLDDKLPIWRLPLQSLGFSPEHSGFAGTFTLSAEWIINLVVTIGGVLETTGFKRLVLFNAHGGQIALLEVAARQLRLHHPRLAVLPCFLWRGAEGMGDLLPEPERSMGLHAGLAETSLMLHLEPDLVGTDRRADAVHLQTPPAGWSLEGASPCAWLTREISSSGVVGDPSHAEAGLGADLYERLVSGWRNRLDGLLRSDWPPTPDNQ